MRQISKYEIIFIGTAGEFIQPRTSDKRVIPCAAIQIIIPYSTL